MTEERRKINEIQRKKTIQFVDSLKTPCVKCGESRMCTIDFHHKNPKLKSFNLSRGIRGRGRKSLQREIKKCICLCRNCHAEFHYLYGLHPEEPEVALNEYLLKK